MGNDMNIMLSTEGLSDAGKEIADESRRIKEALNDINEARKSLEGWISKNKDKFDSKLASSLPKMYEITEIIDSFSGVAIKTSERGVAVENKISAAIDNTDVA